ncbi:MAG: glycine cleavage system protein GcvH [Planctomycetota bacterium]|nr:glycine cleavage system protein GcvH [Planctomycetota bacterium]
MSRPDDVKYTVTHEWARLEGDVVTVGITDYAVEQLSDLAFVDLPESGVSLEKGSRFGEIESTKTVADLIAPVSGEVVEANTEVVENLELLTHSPFADGWLVKIRLSDPGELSGLMEAVAYQAHVDAEDH